jgi:hypothetical protein
MSLLVFVIVALSMLLALAGARGLLWSVFRLMAPPMPAAVQRAAAEATEA